VHIVILCNALTSFPELFKLMTLCALDNLYSYKHSMLHVHRN